MISEFNAIDWLLLFIVLISIVFAARKGFVRELAGIASLVLAFLFASWFGSSAAPLFKDLVKTENLALFCGFSIVFAGTLIAGTLAARLISMFVKVAQLQWFDRFLGALFGLVRGWLLGGIVFFVLTAFNIQFGSVRDSQMAPYFLPASRVIALATPSDFKGRFRSGYAAVERWWKAQQ